MVQVMHDKPDAPSNFTLKLRKHLRTRRLEDVRQLGVDRVVDFVFGTGPGTHHLLLEMYASVRCWLLLLLVVHQRILPVRVFIGTECYS